MNRVVLHESAINDFFHNEEGPVGRLIAVKSAEITVHAHNNLVSHSRSGHAISRLRFVGIFQDPTSLFSLVGTDAQRDGFSYPLALELGGTSPGVWKEGQRVESGKPYKYPWLGPAVERTGFRKGFS